VSDETRFGPRPGVADAPSNVQITVVADPAARPLRERISHTLTPRRAGGLCGLAVVVAVTVAVLAVASSGGRGGAAPRTGSTPRDRGTAGVATAAGLPPRCAAVTMLENDPTYARADFNRASPCARHDAIATAIVHRAGGLWRSAMLAVEHSCPIRSLPRAVQVQLGVCQ